MMMMMMMMNTPAWRRLAISECCAETFCTYARVSDAVGGLVVAGARARAGPKGVGSADRRAASSHGLAGQRVRQDPRPGEDAGASCDDDDDDDDDRTAAATAAAAAAPAAGQLS